MEIVDPHAVLLVSGAQFQPVNMKTLYIYVILHV